MKIYTKKEIDELVKPIIETVKATRMKTFFRKIAAGKDIREKENIFHPTYSLTVEMAERIRVHAELSGYPARIFRAKAPRMTTDEEKYIKDNFKQTTLSVYLDFFSTISRIFHDANWNIDYGTDDNETKDEKGLQSYVETNIGQSGSLENFVKTIFVHQKIVDANGVFLVKPMKVETTKTADGETIFDETVLPKPIPVFYPSSSVLYDETDECIILMSSEKSWVDNGGKSERTGFVFEFADAENIWRIEQFGKSGDYNFKTSLHFKHDMKKMPFVKCKGVPSLVDGTLVWVSQFMYIVDLLDLVTLNSTFLQLIINNCVFPYRVMYGDDCEFEFVDINDNKSICEMGYVFDSGLETKIPCPSCGGSGLKSRINPLGVMLIRTGNALGNSDKDISQPPMAYVEPTTETPRFLMTKIADDEQRARKIMHLNTSSTAVQGGFSQMNPGAETATGQITDLKALYAFVKPWSDQIFEAWEFFIDAIGMQRYGSKYKKPVVQYPVSFDFYTESDYMANIANAVRAGMPPFYIQTIMFKYLQSIYYNEKKTMNVMDLIWRIDRLVTMPNDLIQTKVIAGVIQKHEVVIHDSILLIIKDLEQENKKFWDETFDERKQQIIDKAVEIVDSIDAENAERKQLENQRDVGNILNMANPVNPLNMVS